MINEIKLNARAIARRDAVVREAAPRSMQSYGLRGALLGAVSFAGLFPLALSAVMGNVAGTDMAVYAMSGAIFGVISGGSIGAVIGGEGR
jgi:hypothetical protein